jgi:polar amino acid transport system substrate-binding protein
MSYSKSLAITLSFIISFFGTAVAEELPDLKGREISILVGGNSAPFHYRNTVTGELEGWEIDAIKELSKRLNFKYKISMVPWKNVIPSIDTGNFDMAMDGSGIKKFSIRGVKYSLPYLHFDILMLVRSDEDRFEDITSFRAFTKGKVCLPPNSAFYFAGITRVLKAKKDNPRIVLSRAKNECLKLLKSGVVDMTLIDSASAEDVIVANSFNFKIIGRPVSDSSFRFIFARNVNLSDAFDAGLISMQEDGRLSELHDAWFGVSEQNFFD